MKYAVALLLATLALSTPAFGQVTYRSLIEEMNDLPRLAEMPDPWYATRQFSSYDRRATDPNVPTDENWFANGDRGNYLRIDDTQLGDQFVLLDVDGPGAIVRFWSANPDDAGTLRIYIDDDYEPVIEMPLRDYLSGENSASPAPIGHVAGRGWNSYTPIPFADHCRITCSKPDFYYIIDYRAYAEGTAVESLTKPILHNNVEALVDAARALGEPAHAQLPLEPKTIEPGATLEETIGNGNPGMITALNARVEAEDLETVLRSLVLSITFDDEETVRAPLGDFFGTAPGANEFRSLPLAVEGTTLYSRWAMPFQMQAVLRIENHGGAPADVAVAWSGEAGYDWTGRSMYFHAKWRAEADIPTHPRRDWNFAELAGEGRLVGTMLHIANPVKAWWGEGDEKIYVDGATFPTWFGTGSEDFFGYAWSDNHTFTHAYHNQPRSDGPGNFGHSCVSRFLIMDDIPFANDLKFDMEVWHWEETQVTQSAMVYWYAKAGARDNFGSIDDASLVVPPLPEPPVPLAVPGAIEGEKMRVIQVSGGKVDSQYSDAWPWSRGEQVWWQDAEPGDTLTLGFEVPEFGTYQVRGVFTKAPDYGIATVAVNEDPASTPLDFYHTGVIVTETPIELGTHALKTGENELKIAITGSNDEASPARHMVGVDYLLLERVPDAE